MNYEHPNNDTEILSADEQKLREICRTLKSVDAPKDFDFKLKARIANSKAGDFQPRRRFVPVMRYALPALALILVLGLLAYNGGFLSSGNNSTIAGSPVAPSSITLPENSAVSSFTPRAQTANVNAAILPLTQNSPKPNEVAVRQPKKAETGITRRPMQNEMGGSTDQSAKKATIITPENNMLQSIPQDSQDNRTANPIPVREVLLQNGINADFENGRWTVKSVTPNSLGESSGVKPNDVIEEIDSQPLSGATVFNKIVNGKTVTVTRNGQKSLIRLRLKQ